ncbi:40S ribosomal protein S4 [Plasmodiophora brassicae]|uniref:40S ribosomal protein S4 n=1 Tax=Plasmodiophora brassicae TaxID=37360 RepID=A0A0G4ILX4_PLABS|nr:hypothetical protein PBRA_004785 [Plasmodiophora brassicae]SPQ93361.1 unnamed protein product [Plasmodiophora brassicae]
MARGPKKHLKRLNAPRKWMLSKLGGIFAPRPSPGPHKLRESIPLVILLRNRLKYALTRRECMVIVMNRSIKIDTKVRTDVNFPAGFMDVVTIEKTNENFRILYDTKGRFLLQKIKESEANYKLCRVKKLSKGNKTSVGRNPNHFGQLAAVPFIVTHDGRTIRYPDPVIRVNDTVKVDLTTGNVVDFIKFDLGQLAMITAGNNCGRIGTIVGRDRHDAAFDIVRVRDRKGHTFATRIDNVFVIGKGEEPWVTLPRGGGVRLSIEEDREHRLKKQKEF